MKRSRLRPISKKRAEQVAIYPRTRAAYLWRNPLCEMESCTRKATEIHHRKGRGGALLNDDRFFMAVCIPCHRYIEDNKREMRECGVILYR